MPETFPVPNLEQAISQLRLKPYDTVDILVYQEPDLSLKAGQIDAAGNVLLPVLGEVQATGLSPAELSRDIERRLAARLLVNPQVSVQRSASVLNRVTVVGAVARAGLYEIKGPITMLDAITLAGGTTNVARRSDVAIIRQINGKRAGAIFDISEIERGELDDPAVLPSDKIVVGTSAIRQGYRDLLQVAPLLSIGLRAFREF